VKDTFRLKASYGEKKKKSLCKIAHAMEKPRTCTGSDKCRVKYREGGEKRHAIGEEKARAGEGDGGGRKSYIFKVGRKGRRLFDSKT